LEADIVAAAPDFQLFFTVLFADVALFNPAEHHNDVHSVLVTLKRKITLTDDF